MESSWLFASTAFVTAVLVGRFLSFGEALVVFWGAAIVARLSLERGLRNYLVVVIQALCLTAMLMAVIHADFYASFALISADWIQHALHGPHTKREWVEMVLISLSAISFWVGGTFLAKRRMTYYTICSRFDIGLAVFFSLFLIKLVIIVKGGPATDGPTGLPNLLSFFFLGLLAIGVSRIEPTGDRGFLPGYGMAGVIASFSVLVLLSVGAVMLFLLPALQKTAEISVMVAEKGGSLVAPVAVTLLRFLFGPRSMRPDPPSPSARALGGSGQMLAPTTWFGHLIEDALRWGMTALFVAILILSAGIFIYVLVGWLFSRSGSIEGRRKADGTGWLLRLWLFLSALVSGLRRYVNRRESAQTLYSSLQAWGKRSGLPPGVSDTPSEFAGRVGSAFPGLRSKVDTIVEAFNREVYGDMPVVGTGLAAARSSMGALRSPRHWPSRLKARLGRSGPKVDKKSTIAPAPEETHKR